MVGKRPTGWMDEGKHRANGSGVHGALGNAEVPGPVSRELGRGHPDHGIKGRHHDNKRPLRLGPYADSASHMPVLMRHSRHEKVAELQRRLNAASPGTQLLKISGFFDLPTHEAVGAFQQRNGLVPPDFKVGHETWSWLPPLPVTQRAPPPPPPAPKPQQPPRKALSPAEKLPTCCVSALVVSCSHGGRGFRLNVPSGDKAPDGRRVIQLLGEKETGYDTAKIVLEGGPCKKGKPTGQGKGKDLSGAGDAGDKVPSVSLSGPELSLTGLAPYTAKLRGPTPSDEHFGVVEFLQTLFPPDLKRLRQTFSGSLNCCDGGGDFGFDIDVFTPLKWGGNIAVEYDNSKKEFKVGAEVKGEYGGNSFELQSPSFEKSFPRLSHFLGKVLPEIDKFASHELVKIKLEWPKIKVGGDYSLAEGDDEYSVSEVCKLYFAGDPIIGLQGKTDLLDWLILYSSGPLASVLKKIKDKAAKGVKLWGAHGKAKVAVEFVAKGQIDGRLEWTLSTGKHKVSGKIEPKLDLKLEGKAEADVGFFWVGVRGGVRLAAKSGVYGEVTASIAKGKTAFGGQIKFPGLIIEAVAYYQAGGSSVEKDANSPPGFDEYDDNPHVKGQNEREIMEPWVVLSPWEWPEEHGDKGPVEVGDAL